LYADTADPVVPPGNPPLATVGNNPGGPVIGAVGSLNGFEIIDVAGGFGGSSGGRGGVSFGTGMSTNVE
jgi:hypothetical protein